jgi:hypothetical protein
MFQKRVGETNPQDERYLCEKNEFPCVCLSQAKSHWIENSSVAFALRLSLYPISDVRSSAN